MITLEEFLSGADPNASTPGDAFAAFLGALGGDLDDALAQQVTPEPSGDVVSLDLGTHGNTVTTRDPAADFAAWVLS